MRGLIIAALVVLGSVEALAGGMEPFFYVGICSLEATDIVDLTPSSNKAEFQVVETIKGDLQPGETLILSELYRPEDLSAFTKRDDEPGIRADPPPPMQPGDRVIAFLLRPGAQFVTEFQPKPSNADGWRSANWQGDMRFSAAWLRNGEVFAFFPISNPGTSELHDLDVTEQEFRHQIAKGVQLRASLDQALAYPADSLGRALQLAALVRSDDLTAPWAAITQLKNGSAASAVVLRELLSDTKLVNLHWEIEHALAKNDYRNSGLLLF
jgi:hypothetical protein